MSGKRNDVSDGNVLHFHFKRQSSTHKWHELALEWRHMSVMACQIPPNPPQFGCLLDSWFSLRKRKYQSSELRPFMRGINRLPVYFPCEKPVIRKVLHVMSSSWVIGVPSYGTATGLRLNIKTVFSGTWIPITKMRRSSHRLIFIMGISTLARRFFYIKTGDRGPFYLPIQPYRYQQCASYLGREEMKISIRRQTMLHHQFNLLLISSYHVLDPATCFALVFGFIHNS